MEDEAACRSNPRGEKNRVASASAGITSSGTIETVPLEILLSLAGRMPDLAFANLKV